MDGPQIRTLRRALEAMRSAERLATALDVPLEDLRAYLAAEKPLPHQVFLDALDIVSGGERRLRERPKR
jgi:hypothetical protein